MSIKVTSKEREPKEQEIEYPRLRQFNFSGNVWLETRERNGFYLTDNRLGQAVRDDFSQHSAYNGKITLENN